MKPTPTPFECVEGPAAMPRLEPRRVPELWLACPMPSNGEARRYHVPLWRRYEKLVEGL